MKIRERSTVDDMDLCLEWEVQEIAVRVGSAYFDVLLAQSELEVNMAQREREPKICIHTD